MNEDANYTNVFSDFKKRNENLKQNSNTCQKLDTCLFVNANFEHLFSLK